MSERNLVLYTRKKQEEMLETGVQRESANGVLLRPVLRSKTAAMRS